MEEQERYLPPHSVEEMTGLKYQTLSNQRHLGKGIPYYKVGRAIRYRLVDVIAFMERHRIDPESRQEAG